MTFTQRLEKILEGTIDAAPTNTQLQKVADAFVDSKNDSEILALTGTNRASLTNTQKAQVAVLILKALIKETVKIAPRQVIVRSVGTVPDGDASDL